MPLEKGFSQSANCPGATLHANFIIHKDMKTQKKYIWFVLWHNKDATCNTIGSQGYQSVSHLLHFQNSYHDNNRGKAVEDDQSFWVPGAYLGDLEEAPGFNLV